MLNLAAGFSQSEYTMTRSLRFRASASAYLNRTPVNSNFKTFTWVWRLKRGSIGGAQNNYIAGVSFTGANYNFIGFENDTFRFYEIAGGGLKINLVTTQVFRDPSAWYDIMLVVDTTQSTDSNRVKLYVAGQQVTAFSAATYPTLNYDSLTNTTYLAQLGRGENGPGTPYYFDGYLADVYFIDGQALTPASFGETNALTGVWQPKAYTGTYGTNGFYLDFEDTSSVAALGTDKSGNGNTWTVNNVSLTSGVTYDSMTDVPTLTSETVANYAVLNPLTSDGTISNANLTIAWSGGNSSKPATIGVNSGKWYCEIVLVSAPSNAIFTGIIPASMNPSASYPGSASGGYGYFGDGQKYFNGVGSAYGSAINNGDVVGIAFDLDNGKLWFSRNGTWQASGDPAAGTNAAFTSIPAGTWFLSAGHSGTCTLSANFGQRPFAYTPPTGFKALNTFNLPTATILKGSNEMNIALDTGANIKTTTEALFTGSQFLEWIKDRANANNHQLLDSVRGLTAVLQSNTTAAETTYTAPSGNSVGWAWKAGASAVSNTDGSITSTVSVNASSGFSVVTYTGNGTAGATVGHGLGVALKMIIVKKRNAVQEWMVGHSSLASWNNYLVLNTTAAQAGATTIWNDTAPTSSVFTLGSSTNTNGNTSTFVAYCFAEIDGYSKFGLYAGNGAADGTFIYTGMKTRFLLVKKIGSTGDWVIFDTARGTYNQTINGLFPNLSDAEDPSGVFDILSNGFKLRSAGSSYNTNGVTYIYAAFAENPFKNSLAR